MRLAVLAALILPLVQDPATPPWRFVNGGHPIAGDEPTGTDPFPVEAVVDRDNNYMFVYSSQTLGRCVGRYVPKKRAWETWTWNGWSAALDAIARPIGDGTLALAEVDLWRLPEKDGNVWGFCRAFDQAGRRVLDIHGTSYNIDFDGKDWRWWSASGYAPDKYAPVVSSWMGQTPTYAFDGKKVALVLGVKGQMNTTAQLMAARGEVGDKGKVTWSTWKDGAWKDGLDYQNSPVVKGVNDKEENYIAISVAAIPETSDFLVLAEHRKARDAKIVALLYADDKKTWSLWDGKAWAAQGEPAAVDAPNLRSSRISTLPTGPSRISFAWQAWKANAVRELIYDHKAKSFTLSNSLDVAGAAGFAAGSDNDGRNWLLYSKSGTDVFVRKRDKGKAWQEPVLLFDEPAAKEMRLLGFAAMHDGTPVAFVRCRMGDEKAPMLRAISESTKGWWRDEKPVERRARAESTALDTKLLEPAAQCANDAFDPDNNRAIEYGAQGPGHMAIDADGFVYAPRFAVCGVVIWPSTCPEKQPVYWGGFWDWFYFPMAVAVDNTRKKVYVADQPIAGGAGGFPQGRVHSWDLSMRDQYAYRISLGGNAAQKNEKYAPERLQGQFSWIGDLAVDEKRGLLYVADSLGAKVQIYDVTAAPKRIGDLGKPGDFRFPTGLDVDADGNLYVVDSQNHRVQQWSPQGRLLVTWGGLGRGEGKFVLPFGIAVDRTHKIAYVTDPYNERVQAFTLTGKFVTAWGRWEAAPKVEYVPKGPMVVRSVARFSSDASNAHGIAVDNDGNVLLGLDGTIVRFKPKGIWEAAK